MNEENYIRALVEEDPNILAQYILFTINKNLDEQSILRKIKVKDPIKDIFSNEVKQLIIKKNEIYKRVKKDNCQEDKIQLKNLLKSIKTLKRNEVYVHNKREFDSCAENSRKQWIKAKQHLYGKSNLNIERIVDGDKLIKGSKQVAGTFNRYFIRKVKKIRESLDSPSEDPMISYKKYVKTPKKKLVFSTINMSQLRQVFKNMKKSNSTTIDSISMRTLDRIKTAVLPLILRLINQINITKTFPDCLKIARIQPIRKSFDLSALSCESYRPVNILCPVSKLVEKFWVKDILNHLKLNQMVDQNHQGGFPKRSSTTTNLTIYQKIAQFKLRKKKTAIVQLDQSGAYDVVSHRILQLKLEHIGLDISAVQTLMSYLKNRKQYVRLNGNNSDTLLTGDVSVGQGSVISGILYGILVLDQNCQLHRIRHSSNTEYYRCEQPHIETFVDDCFGLLHADTNQELIDKIIYFITSLNSYYTNNELKNNIKKSSIMFITDDPYLKSQEIKVIGTSLYHKTNLKLLGTVFSDNMKWNKHIRIGNDSLLARLKKRMNAIKYIKNKVSLKFARQLGTSLFYSILLYQNELWGNTTGSNLNKIDSIIVKMARYLNGKDGIGRTDQWNLNQLKWFNMSDLYKYNSIKYIHKTIHSDSDHFIKQYLLSNRNDRNRKVNKLGPHKAEIGRNYITQNTILYSAVSTFNSLPDRLTRITRHKMFRRWLKRWIVNKNVDIPINQFNPENLISDPDFLFFDNNLICEKMPQGERLTTS